MPIKDQTGKKAPRKAKLARFKTVRVVGVETLGPEVEVEIMGIKGTSQETIKTAKEDAFEKAIRRAAELTGLPAGPVIRYHHKAGVYRCKVAIG